MMNQTKYNTVYVPLHPRANSKGCVREHIVIAEKALGRTLPIGAEVHHIDYNRGENKNTNLVICQDHKYHALLHQRTDALRACGHADWLKCRFCKKYDALDRLYINGRVHDHRSCITTYKRRMGIK